MDWSRRYAKSHRMRSRADLDGGEAKIEAFLTDLAINQNVAPATQNQAMNALVFLYKKVLEQPLDERIHAVRAEDVDVAMKQITVRSLRRRLTAVVWRTAC